MAKMKRKLLFRFNASNILIIQSTNNIFLLSFSLQLYALLMFHEMLFTQNTVAFQNGGVHGDDY